MWQYPVRAKMHVMLEVNIEIFENCLILILINNTEDLDHLEGMNRVNVNGDNVQ